MIAAPRLAVRLPRANIFGAIAAAWVLALVAEASGLGPALHHDRLIESGRVPWWVAFALFLVGWQVMIAAMMLPSSLPLIRLFNRTAASQPRASQVKLSFLLGYIAVWTGFGAFAFLGDFGVHQAVDQWPWLDERPWLIGGGVLLIAGAFQFSRLKDQCLDQCRHPGAYLMTRYRRGIGEAFRLGRGHGLFCLGCCWALMLVSFAAGIANLAWMGLLTLLMVFEKTGKGGQRGVKPIGLGLLALGVLVLLHPAWLPSLFAAR